MSNHTVKLRYLGHGVPPVRSTLQENALYVAVWRKAHPLFVYTNTEVKTSRAKDTWGIAPGKVGHRQVNKRKTTFNEVVFQCLVIL